MYDNFKLYNYSKSLVSPEGYGRHESNFLSGDIINGFETVIGTGLQVTTKPGNAIIRNGSGGTASAHLVSLTADFTVTLATADASNPRIDAIVLYVDTSVALPSGTPTAANLDGLGVAKLIKVNGTPNANPSAPNMAAIQSAIGSASYPYVILANWRVNAGVSALSQTNCTDMRVFALPRNPRAAGSKGVIESGCTWTYTIGTLNGAGAAGQVLIPVGSALVPQPVDAATKTFTASRDTYIYITLGNSAPQYAETTVGGVQPTLPANSLLVAVMYSGSSITSVSNQRSAGAVVVGVIPASTFTSTGVKRINGLGGAPKAVEFSIMPFASTGFYSFGAGAMDANGSQFWAYTSGSTTASARESGNTAAIVVRSSGTNNALFTASYSSMNFDGFSINVTTASASAFDVGYKAYL